MEQTAKAGQGQHDIFVTRSSLPPMEEYIAEIKDIWQTHWLTNMGAKHEALRQALQQYLGVDQLHLFVNGHMSLELSLQALKLTGEVITTPFTFASTTHAIVRNGLTPVFCDIRPDDYTIDTEKMERLITDRTTAIVPVHVYGNVCQVEEIQRIADKYGLVVLYDAAHAFGETYRGRGVASFGDVSCFSFHATKVFHTIEGGAACYSDRLHDFGLDLFRLKNFGIRGEEEVDAVGANAKMNEFCAAMGLCNLRHLDVEIQKRGQAAGWYRARLADVPGLQLNIQRPEVKPNYAYFPVVFDEHAFGATRNEVYTALAREGIHARKYFYPLTNTFECYRHRFDANDTPIALHIAKRVLTLPLYAGLTEADVDRICQIVLRCGKG